MTLTHPGITRETLEISSVIGGKPIAGGTTAASTTPVAVPSWYIVPALLCGNAVVWKPADYSPACAHAMCEVMWHAGVPSDVLNLVQVHGATASEGLGMALGKGLVHKVGFTGSTEVG